MFISEEEKMKFIHETVRELNDKLIKKILTDLTQFDDLEKFKKYVEGSYIKQNEWIGGVYDTIVEIEDFFIKGKVKDGDGEHIEPVCVNCKHDYHDANGFKPNQCWTCCNGWKGERFTENHFERKDGDGDG